MATVEDLRAELERLGVSYRRAGAANSVALHDLGEVVWLKGPPLSGLRWEGVPRNALDVLRAVSTDVGPAGFWRALKSAGARAAR